MFYNIGPRSAFRLPRSEGPKHERTEEIFQENRRNHSSCGETFLTFPTEVTQIWA
jgi:hypothetical protein